MRIDFVSDIVCPWCAVGLAGLERALSEIGDAIPVELHFQPFELNPDMPPEGTASGPYLKAKYGLSDEQLRANARNIAQRGAAAGFAFGERTHIWGTFDAHRLLAWAATLPDSRAQRRLKHALLEAYHRDGRNPSGAAVLLDVVAQVGMDVQGARAVLESAANVDVVREAQREWRERGITAVPAAIIDDQYVIAGGQPSETYAKALRQIAADRARVQPNGT
jgi:predicted DsbA family dithiol-disulfide isomerase